MARPGPHIEVGEERETSRGWAYDVVVARPAGATTRHEVTLSWVDHDHWSGGASQPSQVIGAVLHALLTMDDGPVLPEAFDLAKARRWAPDIDERLTL